MDTLHLSKRLQVVADFVDEGARLADIGSDHAYLPCYLVEKNKIEWAVAGEVVQGPYQNAKKEVESRSLHDRIAVRLGDGLAVLSPSDSINTVTIAGMGGSLIRSILEKGMEESKITGTEVLILQPNINERTIREFLVQNQYEIVEETIVEENRKIYEIIKAVPSDNPLTYSEKELLFGPILLESKPVAFIKKWKSMQQKNQYILSQMEKSESPDQKKLNALRKELNLIEEVLS